MRRESRRPSGLGGRRPTSLFRIHRTGRRLSLPHSRLVVDAMTDLDANKHRQMTNERAQVSSGTFGLARCPTCVRNAYLADVRQRRRIL
jgi:hypothetical protein